MSFKSSPCGLPQVPAVPAPPDLHPSLSLPPSSQGAVPFTGPTSFWGAAGAGGRHGEVVRTLRKEAVNMERAKTPRLTFKVRDLDGREGQALARGRISRAA